MNYRHKPHKDTRQTPTAAQLQQKVVDVRGLIHEMRTIVAEGEQPLVKITIMCNFCGSSKYENMDREVWLDNYAPETVIDEVCYYCGMDIEEGLPL